MEVNPIHPDQAALLAAENEIELLDHLATSLLAESYASDALRWVITGVQDNTHNGITFSHLSAVTADRTIQETLNRFGERHIWFQWYVIPSSQPADLGMRLHASGCIKLGSGNIMFADLEQIIEPPTPDNVVIQRVETTSQMSLWQEVFDEDGDERDGTRLRLYVSLLGSTRLSWYIALLNDKPIAVSMLFLGKNAAGLTNVATLRSFRRRGIGTAVTLAALRQARASGYALAVLAPSPDGYPMYKRLGFQLHPCPSESYVLGIDEDSQ